MSKEEKKSSDTTLWMNWEEYQFNQFFMSNWYRLRNMKDKNVYEEFEKWKTIEKKK